MWSQPPGTGKTRTLMSLVWILTVVGNYKHITIRCPSLVLLDQDRFALKEIQAAAASRGTKVVFQRGHSNLGKPDTIELVDEADSLVIDDNTYVEKRHSVGQLIGFTATPLKADENASERHLLDVLNIHVHDSCIPDMLNLTQEDL